MKVHAGVGQRSGGSTAAMNVVFVLLGVAGLMLKARYSRTQMELVHSYGGNVAGSFAVYFILATPVSRMRFGKVLNAVLALGVVELFEATDGFAVMTNTYDSGDFLANGVGIVLALLVDILASRAFKSGAARGGQGTANIQKSA